MMVAPTKVEDIRRFLEIFRPKVPRSDSGPDRKVRPCFATPTRRPGLDAVRLGSQRLADFVGDPKVPPILREAGTSVSHRQRTHRPVQFLTASRAGAR